jgi:hypothetical protein
MHTPQILSAALMLSTLLLAAPTALSAKELSLTEFTKVEKNDEVGEVVRCSIRTYLPPPPPKKSPMAGMGLGGMMGGGKSKPVKRPEIVLISMIHLGEKGFFQAVKKELATCDLVLYEEQGDSDLGGLSGKMITGLTGLAFQGTEIPFNEKTWRSADLSSDALFRMLGMDPAAMKRMKKMMKNMGGFKLDKRMLESNPMLKQMIPSREKIVAQLRGSGSSDKMAEGFGEMADVILYQRNAIAIGELTKASHEEHKRVALIYGAAHMPGIEAYLTKTLHYKHQGTVWHDAVYADAEVSKARAAGGPSSKTPTKPQPKVRPKQPANPKGKGWF